MIIKRTPIALALASALLSAGTGAAALSHSSLPAHIAPRHVESSGTGRMLGPDGKANIIVTLKGEPATRSYARALQAGGGGLVAQSSANSAAHSAIASLKLAQDSLATELKTSGVEYTELYRVQRVLNAIAVRMRPEDMQKVRGLPNVERVAFLPVYKRPSNLVSVPFVDAPRVWDGGNGLGLPFNATGKGIKIGDIDTGLDYIHPDFGGSGALADYQDVDPTSVIGRTSHNVLFPTLKVAGGTDFAGDAYDATNDPIPDPNPMDCDSHGSHTAGTLAGLGVNSDGTPYSGIYNPTVPYAANLRIGPGMAPDATLYALRVFGCGGSTSLVTEAIEWATDPNGNGDLSDRLDVINMSLGSAFGVDSAQFNADIEAADNAALAGMIVVSASGNDGDTFFISEAPGANNAGISAAASVDDGQTTTELHVSSPAVADFAAIASAFSNPDGIAPPAPGGQSGTIVLALDSTGGLSQGCGGATVPDPTAFSNATALNGNFALVDRGACSFYIKVLNAQAAGAIGVIIDNNAANAALITMGNSGTPLPTAIVVPSLFISKESGAAIKGELASTVASTFNAIVQPQLADTIAGFSGRGPVTGDGGVIELKPDIAAPGLNIPSVQSGITCDEVNTFGCITPSDTGFIPGGQVLTISGTSMATPHIAGMMALLRQLNPEMSVEQLKALAINGAAHDVSSGNSGAPPLFGASRVGAGRIDPAASATSSVIAYNHDVPGAVSVTFDVEPVGSAFTATHTVTLANRTATARNVTLAIDPILDSPGAGFSVPGGTIAVPASGSTTFTVTLNADTSQMTRYIDPTMATIQNSAAFGFSLPRQYLAEESSLIKVLDSNTNTELARLPVYATLRPHSTLSTASDLGSSAPLSGTANLALSGQDVCTGTVAAGSCSAFPSLGTTGEESLVSAFELQFTGARDATLPVWANLHYLGVNSGPDSDGTDTDLFFGIAAYGKWGSPNYVSYNVCIDSDGDGLFDKILMNTDLGSLDQLFGVPGAEPEDTFVSAIFDNVTGNLGPEFALNLVDASGADTGALSNNTMFIPAIAADLGLTSTKFHYGVAVCPAAGFGPLCGNADWTSGGQGTANCGTAGSAYKSFNGPFTYDSANPGIGGAGDVLLEDLNGGVLAVNYDVGNLVANGSNGMLLLHTHNTVATSAQVVVLDRLFADGFGN